MGILRVIALFLGCCTVASAAAPFQISEFMAVNSRSTHDEDGDSSDWIEIHNAGTEVAFLDGWFLTDDAFDLTKWRFPAGVEVQPNSYRIVFASDKNRTNALGPLHTNFRLSSGGEYLALVGPEMNVVSEFSPTYPEQFTDVSYGRDVADPNLLVYFPRPTPGERNVTGGPGFSPEVNFSRRGGTFALSQPFFLMLSTFATNTAIYYSLGTNVPSLIYTNAIWISNSTIVRARCVQAGLLPGPVDSRSYLALSNDVLNFSSDLPLMIVHNFGQGDVTTINQYVAVQTFEPVLDRSYLTNEAAQTERGRFHIRGVTSSQAPKKPFFLEIQDEFGADKESALLGLPEESDWVLYAPYIYDPPMMHNPVAYEIMRDFGRYAPRTRYVELFLKDNSGVPGPVTAADYQGIYVFTEKIKRDNNRVALDSLEPEHLSEPEITGGYLLSRDPSRDGDGPPLRVGNFEFWWISPRTLEMTNLVRKPQVQYISNYLANLSSVLAGSEWTNPISGYTLMIDCDSWIDYHVHQAVMMGADSMGPSTYFYKPREGKLAFGPPWDFDRSQGTEEGTFSFNPLKWGVAGIFSPSYVPWWRQLFRDPDFWQKWIDRYQELRKGALSTNSIFVHIDEFASQLWEAQVRDEARWGVHPRSGIISSGGFSYNFGSPPSFTNEVLFLKFWYANRLYFLDSNFLDRPTINHDSGHVEQGLAVTVTPATKNGTVLLYTLDGSDPRLSGGAISPLARSNTGPVTVTVMSNICIVARSYNPAHSNSMGAYGPLLSSPWSGLSRAVLYFSIPLLRISEIMYHPDLDEGFEFVKVINIGTEPLNMNRFKIRGGVDFDLPAVELPAGASAIVAANETIYRERYGDTDVILGSYTGHLDNGGERLQLFGPCEEPILDFRYEDEWYGITDGFGSSLVVVDATAPLTNWSMKAHWRSKGGMDSSPVVINEVLSHSEVPPPYDSVELYNASDAPVDVSYWFLTDDLRTPRKYQIPPETIIPGRGFRVFDESDFNFDNIAGVPFSFSSLGDEVFLFSADIDGYLTGYLHGFDFGAQEDGVTFGRYITGSGEERFVRQSQRTLGAPNAGPAIGPIVISEIMYHPRDRWRDTEVTDNQLDEFIELHNIAQSPVVLSDPEFPLNTWRLSDAVTYSFPPGISVPANGFVVLVSFDTADAGLVSAFRAHYGVPGSVPVLGPYSGKLDNSRERVVLRKPDVPRPSGPPDFGFVPYVVMDSIEYTDSQPWPYSADGYGASLQRVSDSTYDDDVANWLAAAPSAGRSYTSGPGPVITRQPAATDVVEYTTGTLRVEASGTSRLIYQWIFNGERILDGTNATLVLTNTQTWQAGIYEVIISDAAGWVRSTEAQLTILDSVEIVRDPASQIIGAGSNVTFTVEATSSTPIGYQWKFNGSNIAGARSTTLTINNVTNIHEGWYSVLASNAISARESQPAFLTVLLAPRMIAPSSPLRITATTNQSITLGAQTSGTLPLYYRWRRTSPSGVPSTISNVVQNSRTHFATFAMSGLSNGTYAYLLSLSNVVLPSLATAFTNAFITIVPDSDNDGLPDTYETAHGFLPNDPSDGRLDRDGDGLSNLEEFLAGTDPNDPDSFLKIDSIFVVPPVVIRFGAVSNRTYRIEYSDFSVGGPWQKLTEILPQPNNHIEVVVDTVPATNRFYRAAIPGPR